MSHNIGDLINERTSTSGTGDLVLTGAVADNYVTWANGVAAGTVYYVIQDGNNIEGGIGTFDGATTIVRTTVQFTITAGVYNGSSPSPLSLSGVATVACVLTAAAYNDKEDADPAIQTHITDTSGNPHDIGLIDIEPETVIGTPTNIDNLNEIYNHHYSSGILSGGTLTDNLDGTIGIAAGECLIRATDSGSAQLIAADFAAAATLALTDNTTNYVYVDYNAGSPTPAVTTDATTINMTTRVAHCLVVREGTTLTILSVGADSTDANAKHRKKMFFTDTFTRANGGAIISNPSGLYIACTAGSFYFGLVALAIAALDTTGADTITHYYTADSGATWLSSDDSELDATNYNDITSGLAAMGSNKYCNHWIYSIMDTEGNTRYAMVHGQAEFNSLAEAADEAPPSVVPPSIAGLGVLLGAMTVKKSGTTVEEVRTAFTTTFNSAQVTSHTELADIGTNSHVQIDTELTRLDDMHVDMNEPTGFIREFPLTMGVLEFSDDGTNIKRINYDGTYSSNATGLFYDGTSASARQLSISPVNVGDGGDGTFTIYTESVKHVKSAAQRVTIADSSGLQFVYFDKTGTLQTSSSLSTDYFEDTPIVSVIYWDKANTQSNIFGDERHGITMSGAEHRYHHFTDGCRYVSGMDVTGLADGSGSYTNISAGEAYDEDVVVTPALQTNTPKFYLEWDATETKNVWRRDTADTDVAHLVTAIAQYNSESGGQYSLSNITGNDAGIMFFFMTNDSEYPYCMIVGQNNYATVNAARAAIEDELDTLILTGLPAPEIVAIGAIIIDASGNLQEITGGELIRDLRSVKLAVAGGTGSLADKLDKVNGVMTGMYETISALGTAASHDLDVSTANVFTATCSGNTTITASGWTTDASGCELQLTTLGTETITWTAVDEWDTGSAPTNSAAGTMRVVLTSVDGGTTVKGSIVKEL